MCNREYLTIKPSHGYFKGNIEQTDIFPTLDTGTAKNWHCVLGEPLRGGQEEYMALDEQNGYIRQDGCVGTLTTDGSSPRHNNRIIEPKCDCLGMLGGKYENMHEQSRRVYGTDGIAPTQHTCNGGNLETKIKENYRIRKLTPKECFRLMGVKDKDFDNIAEAQSNSSLYHLAGDSIVVDVLMAIFGGMI